MVLELEQRISERALTLWRIHGALQAGITIVLSIGLMIAVNLWDWPKWTLWIAVAVVIFSFILKAWLIPSLQWKRWRYRVTESEIGIQHGMFIVKRTLVPMVRVQHVDTEQGPLLRKYKLSTISISTAATVHRIPALDEYEAEELRKSISSLARVADDD